MMLYLPPITTTRMLPVVDTPTLEHLDCTSCGIEIDPQDVDFAVTMKGAFDGRCAECLDVDLLDPAVEITVWKLVE